MKSGMATHEALRKELNRLPTTEEHDTALKAMITAEGLDSDI